MNNFVQNPLWSGAELIAALCQANAFANWQGNWHGEWQASGVSIDSRTLQSGDIFVALRGDNFDGHDYVDAAITAGAVAVIAKKSYDSGVPPVPYFVVGNCLQALNDLARVARARLDKTAKILALTASVGKTSTKTALTGLLARYGKTHTSFGNFNNHIGVPLSLARMPRDTQFAVFEIGTSQPGEILPLAQLVAPQFALIGTIASAHLQYFGTEAAIADEKGFLMNGLVLGDDSAVILDRDGLYFDEFAARARHAGVKRILSYGAHPNADLCFAAEYFATHDVTKAANVGINYQGRKFSYTIPTVGAQHIRVSVAALAGLAAMVPEIDLEQASRSFAAYEPMAGRGKISDLVLPDGRHIRLIDESYNASPISMAAAIQQMSWLRSHAAGGRKIAVLGDMLEIGDTSDHEHVKLGQQIAQAPFPIDKIYTVGAASSVIQSVIKPTQRGLHADSAEKMLAMLLDAKNGLQTGDVVLAKGSHGSKIYQLVEKLIAQSIAGQKQKNGGNHV
ncbi:MAG: UDP-N-acetylmuramoyl-tripeptide--D-alanyl-D-alanine ligase [Alphaproteobacteria bacterium]|nr:UDP-N-acetylmuramoyl-tripeptide--D-alanyl-D-alanine ligase [Alphaproteobacteria bacterium]